MNPDPKPRLHIDFVSDVACPWCAVGLNALERALAELAPELSAELRFQPFELNPAMGKDGEDTAQHLMRKYGMGAADLERSRAVIRDRGAAVGFVFGDRQRIWNTFDAHRLLHWAGLQGRQHALKQALLQAYHGQGRNVSDRAVLVELAAAAGLDPSEARTVLDTDRFAEEVRAAEREWQQAGIHSVPAVVVDGRHLIQGGQPPEVFLQALRQIAASAG